MSSSWLLLGTVSLVAACGPKSSQVVEPTSNNGAPFDHGQVQQAIAAMPATGCNEEPGDTFGDVFQRNNRALGDPGSTDLKFDCRAQPDDTRYECTWSTFSRPGVPEGDADPTAAGDNPCAGECCAGFQIIFMVERDGTIIADTTVCNAPG